MQSGKKAVVSEGGKHISTTSLYGYTYLKGSHIDDTTARLDQIADSTWSPWTDSETTRTLPAAARRFTVLAADVSRTMEHLQSQVSRGYYEMNNILQAQVITAVTHADGRLCAHSLGYRHFRG